MSQLLTSRDALPVPLDQGALVVSGNADLYGTVADLRDRVALASP